MNGHEAPLRLRQGSDARLRGALVATGVLAFAAIVLGGGTPILKSVQAILLIAVLLWIRPAMFQPNTAPVTLYPNGRARIGAEHCRWTGRAWISRWYCVLECSGANRVKRILISAARQEPDEYRKLLCWTRLGRQDPG